MSAALVLLVYFVLWVKFFPSPSGLLSSRSCRKVLERLGSEMTKPSSDLLPTDKIEGCPKTTVLLASDHPSVHLCGILHFQIASAYVEAKCDAFFFSNDFCKPIASCGARRKDMDDWCDQVVFPGKDFGRTHKSCFALEG